MTPNDVIFLLFFFSFYIQRERDIYIQIYMYGDLPCT